MRTYAAVVVVVMVSATIAFAAEPKTPSVLLGRWAAVKIQTQGKPEAPDEIKLEFEFTPTQLYVRLNTKSQARTPQPMHIYDCFFQAADGLLKLDLKTASNSPGPETGIHVRAIFEVAGVSESSAPLKKLIVAWFFRALTMATLRPSIV